MYNCSSMEYTRLDHKKLIEDAKAELYYTLKQRNAANTRIGQLNKILRGLASTLPAEQRDELLSHLKIVARKPAGLTDAISEVLQSDKGDGLSANDIRDQLENAGFDLSDYSQPAATITNTLMRLKEGGKVKRRIVRGRGFVWEWSAGFTMLEDVEIFRPEE